eukprot:558085-Pleurochrysis_carterae.AAC.1
MREMRTPAMREMRTPAITRVPRASANGRQIGGSCGVCQGERCCVHLFMPRCLHAQACTGRAQALQTPACTGRARLHARVVRDCRAASNEAFVYRHGSSESLK